MSGHLAMYGVQQGHVNQSDTNIRVKGGGNKAVVLNRVDHCGRMDVRQDNTNTVIEPTPGSEMTAVNYITNTRDYRATNHNSLVRVIGGSGGGITAHTVVGGNSVVTINASNTTTIVEG